LLVLLTVGTILSIVGGGLLLSFTQNYSNNLGIIDTGIIAGWSPDNTSDVSRPSVQINLVPLALGGESRLTVQIYSSIFTNKSYPFVFFLTTPFTITNLEQNTVFADSPDFYRSWSYYNSTGGSVVYFTSRPLINGTMRAGTISTGASFDFTGLLLS